MERPDKLYHGSRFPGVLTELSPSVFAKEKNGVFGNFAFATHRLDQAILYAADFPAGGSFLTTAEPRTNSGALLLLMNETAAQMFSRPVNGRVYELPVDGFHQVSNAGVPSREWVSGHNQAVPIPRQTPVPVSGYMQVMEAGVQLFTLPAGAQPHSTSEIFTERLALRGDGRAEQIGRLLAQPNSPLVWQNYEHKTGMDQSILRALMDASRLLSRRKHRPLQP